MNASYAYTKKTFGNLNVVHERKMTVENDESINNISHKTLIANDDGNAIQISLLLLLLVLRCGDGMQERTTEYKKIHRYNPDHIYGIARFSPHRQHSRTSVGSFELHTLFTTAVYSRKRRVLRLDDPRAIRLWNIRFRCIEK